MQRIDRCNLLKHQVVQENWSISVQGQSFDTWLQDRQSILNWMAFYNYRGLHSSLGYLSRMQYEQRWYEVQRKKAA